MRDNKRFFKRLLALAAACLLAAGSLGASALGTGASETPYSSYTYWETFSGEGKPAYGRAVYEPAFSIDAAYLGRDALGKISDVCTDENGSIYLLDSAQSRIYILNAQYQLQRTLEGFTRDGAQVRFDEAEGIYCRYGRIYLCDTTGGRVLVADPTGRLLQEITRPASPLIPENFPYRPIRVAVDSNRYVYILCDGSYYGALLCSDTGEFLNFYGANLTESGVLAALQNLWNKLTMTNEKRSKTASSIPYQFNDLYIDDANFVYTATGRGVSKGQVRKLSPGGIDVLRGSNQIYGDVSRIWYYNEQASIGRIPDTSNLAVDGDGFLYLLDTTYGRVFLYDSENCLLSAFGGGMGFGDQLGTFQMPEAVELNGSDVLVADSTKNCVTVFRITDYGARLLRARRMTISGQYTESRGLWEELLREDRNCQLAYVGLAKAAYAEKEYNLALRYAKLGNDREMYSQAFKYIRNDFVRSHFNWLALGLVVLLGGTVALVVLYRRRRPATATPNVRLQTARSLIFHPFDSFANIRYKGWGSAPIALALAVAFYLSRVLEMNFGGFLFATPSSSQSNALFLLLRTFGFIALWTVANTLVTTLMGGLGRMKEIFITVCYSLIPMMLYSLLYLVLSNVLIAEEGTFLGVFSVLSIGYTVVLLLVGHIVIHDFSFSKTILSFVLTLLAIAILIFFLFIFVILVQQLAGFLQTLLLEARRY